MGKCNPIRSAAPRSRCFHHVWIRQIPLFEEKNGSASLVPFLSNRVSIGAFGQALERNAIGLGASRRG